MKIEGEQQYMASFTHFVGIHKTMACFGKSKISQKFAFNKYRLAKQ
jgi:hypothetical protein